MDDEVTIVSDVLARVVLDALIHVFFGVHEKLFVACLIFEADLVEVLGGAVLGAAGEDSATGVVGGQFIGRHVVGVVDGAGDERAIGVAFQELDYNLVADAGPEMGPARRDRKTLREPNPAGTVFVVLAETVPEKLGVNASVLVEETFFAALDGHNGGLRSEEHTSEI